MKYFIVFFMMVANLAFGQELAEIANITIHSEKLNQEREILVYTPQSYKENTAAEYDVIYVFDAQNREFFDYTHSLLKFINVSTTKYIVVGIPSLYDEKTDYTRNDDLLPPFIYDETRQRFNNHGGNADNLMLFIKDELKPFVKSKYKTSGNSIAVGHSNSASFIIYSLTKFPELFDNYIAISPNFANDKEELAKSFKKINFGAFTKEKFLYLSNASEEQYSGWESWKPARETVYSFLRENEKQFPKLHFVIDEFPDEEHRRSFIPALANGLKAYFNYEGAKVGKVSEALYDVTITVKVPNKTDEIFITGNQPELGGWQPDKIKLSKKSAFIRQIKLKLHTPAQFKFTKGSWQTELYVKGVPTEQNIKADVDKNASLEYEILKSTD